MTSGRGASCRSANASIITCLNSASSGGNSATSAAARSRDAKSASPTGRVCRLVRSSPVPLSRTALMRWKSAASSAPPASSTATGCSASARGSCRATSRPVTKVPPLSRTKAAAKWLLPLPSGPLSRTIGPGHAGHRATIAAAASLLRLTTVSRGIGGNPKSRASCSPIAPTRVIATPP